jgi:putative FmdB family regulatory protein
VPTYAYVCTACAHSFDIVQAITDDALTQCPSCGGQLRKKFHPVGVTFKGSGFYRTDSRAEASASTEGASSSGTKDGASKDSGSSEASSNGSGTSKKSADSGGSKSSGDSKSSGSSGGSSSKPAASSSGRSSGS